MKKVFLIFAMVLLLAGCSMAPKRVIAEIPYSADTQAVLVGSVLYDYEGLLGGHEIKNGGFWILRVPFNEDGSEPEIEAKEILANRKKYDQFYIHGEEDAYFVKPGKYFILPYHINLGSSYYSLVNPAKKNPFIGVFTGLFDSDFWSSPSKWVGDHNPTIKPLFLGELTVRAGEVIYFGDVTLSYSDGSLQPFITANELETARAFLIKERQELANQVQFRAWQGRFFPPQSKARPIVASDSNATGADTSI